MDVSCWLSASTARSARPGWERQLLVAGRSRTVFAISVRCMFVQLLRTVRRSACFEGHTRTAMPNEELEFA